MSTPKKVCIVDDDAVYTYGIKKLLKNSVGTDNILTFENGKQALDGMVELFRSQKDLPDVILLDLNMPQMNGWEFLSEFEKLRSGSEHDVNIFVISSQINSEQEEIFRVKWDNKVSDFIQKPVDTEALLRLIN